MSEAQLTARVVAYLRTLPGVWYLKVHGGGPYQRVGVPDLLVCREGRLYAMELKTPTGAVRPTQYRELAALTAAGATAGVVRSLEEMHSLLTRGGTDGSHRCGCCGGAAMARDHRLHGGLHGGGTE